jgi:hypothetical protein
MALSSVNKADSFGNNFSFMKPQRKKLQGLMSEVFGGQICHMHVSQGTDQKIPVDQGPIEEFQSNVCFLSYVCI